MSLSRRFNVKALRESMGNDQKAFAQTVGVDERTIRRWENDGVEPSPMAVRRLREIQQHVSVSPESTERAPQQEPSRRPLVSGGGVVPSRRPLSGGAWTPRA